MVFDKTLGIRALRTMLLCRYFEDKTEELFSNGVMHGTTHLSTGQEAAEAGLCLALDEEDWIVPTHRCHGVTIARGSSPFAMFSEMLGSRHGLAMGLGGSMHMPDAERRNLGSSAVVGSGVPLATGVAFALKKNKSKNISVAIFGDGASSRGSIHESMNLASIWSLPVLFYLENNLYGMSASVHDMVSAKRISDRAAAYNISSVQVDGNDVEEVYAAVRSARESISAGNGPVLIEAVTYRQKGHSKNDRRIYRSREEEAAWLEKDPISLFESRLASRGVLLERELRDIETLARQFIESEAEKALALKDDILSPEEAESLVYSPRATLSHALYSQKDAAGEKCRERSEYNASPALKDTSPALRSGTECDASGKCTAQTALKDTSPALRSRTTEETLL